jgi:outer membrane receptor for ferric coprogen and ferric-rhodotorulic acid
MNKKRITPDRLYPMKLRDVFVATVLATAALLPCLSAQTVATDKDEKKDEKTDEPVLELSPFQVTTDKDNGYAASSSLAGSRLNTELRDIASAVQVVTADFAKDIGATNIQKVLIYTTISMAATPTTRAARAACWWTRRRAPASVD